MSSEEPQPNERFSAGGEGLVRNFTRRSGEISVIIKDTSRNGFLVESTTEFQPGDAVEITVRDEILLGEVAYVREENRKWLVGVKLRHSLSKSRLRRILEEWR